VSEHQNENVWGIIVAAGSGTRYGSAKQYEVLRGRRVLDWARQSLRTNVEGVVMVVPEDRVGKAEPGANAVVAGGATRSASVRAGLAAVPDRVEIIVVHDAARPLARSSLVASVIQAVRDGADAAVPGIDVADTIRSRDGGVLDRSQLVAVQTPQAFRAEVLRRAHEGEPEATDDSALVEAVGGTVVIVEGQPDNFKITTPSDLKIAGLLLG
jgi:2-C-methyl-D-erythritol 4-phosphate cytidylyltransferase